MKKIPAMMLIAAFGLAITACGKNNKPIGEEIKATEEAAPAPTETTESSEAPEEAVEEDGQNPVMNFIGSYAVGRANIDVSCEGQSDAKFLVTWGSSAFETSSWEMSGTLDTNTLTVPYSNCTRTDIVFSEDGSETDTVVYENGTGTFTFHEDGSLTWQDDMENAAEDMVFLFNGGEPMEEVLPEYEEVSIDYGTSGIYSEDERNSAIEIIRETFDTWDGCVLHSITYAGDDCTDAENLEWLNSMNEGQNYTQCIEFLSDFHSPVENAGAWEPDTEYTDYQWWLARTDSGEWELLSYGY